ncbi:MAG: cytochrome c family protein [Proteobacteria bacterium]|nr:cytochrome c family protein [Pseudomonadota bacterium]
MASLELNKFAAGILCAGLLAMVAGKVAGGLVHPVYLEQNAYVVDTSALGGAATSPAEEGPSMEPILALLATADVAKGQKAFKKCAACHTADKGGKNKIGPNLYGVVNAGTGGKDGFKYSAPLTGLGGNWDYASLNSFLTKPKAFVPGTKMNFPGFKKVGDRAAVIAYLRSLADSPAALPTAVEIAKEASGG